MIPTISPMFSALIKAQVAADKRERLERERRFLQSLDWTPSQLAAYGARVLGIQERSRRFA